jgi:hypothetical protein
MPNSYMYYCTPSIVPTVATIEVNVKTLFSHWPEGALFRNTFGTGPPEGPLSLRDNGGFGFVFVSEKIFFIRSLMPRARFPHLTTE